MAYITMHFAPTARGTGDGSTYDNAAELFPSGNWNSVLTSNNYATSGIVGLVQNTAQYTLNQQGTAAVFSGGAPTNLTYPLVLKGCDSFGNILNPVDYGWKCAAGDLDESNFVDLDYTLTTGSLSNATNIHMRCFKISATVTSATLFNLFHGLLDWCKLYVTSTNTLGIGVSYNTTTIGIVNSQINMIGSSFARILTASSGGLVSNIRVKGDPSASSGTRYGVAVSSSSVVTAINGPVFICDCAGIGLLNYSTNLSAGIAASRMTIVNCGTGVATLNTSSGGGKLVITDSVITGCTSGLNQPYGKYDLRNVVLRNTTDIVTTSENDISEPFTFITSETDADLYVDSSNGDYRIKSTSAHWGKNRGSQDELVLGDVKTGISIGRQLAKVTG